MPLQALIVLVGEATDEAVGAATRAGAHNASDHDVTSPIVDDVEQFVA
jgi:hypothetical protein